MNKLHTPIFSHIFFRKSVQGIQENMVFATVVLHGDKCYKYYKYQLRSFLALNLI